MLFYGWSNVKPFSAYRPKMLKHTCKAKEKKLLVSVWAPGWDFFSDYAAGKFLPKQQVN